MGKKMLSWKLKQQRLSRAASDQAAESVPTMPSLDSSQHVSGLARSTDSIILPHFLTSTGSNSDVWNEESEMDGTSKQDLTEGHDRSSQVSDIHAADVDAEKDHVYQSMKSLSLDGESQLTDDDDSQKEGEVI